jgi:hypothetical protein
MVQHGIVGMHVLSSPHFGPLADEKIENPEKFSRTGNQQAPQQRTGMERREREPIKRHSC